MNPGNWNCLPWLLNQVGENGNVEEGKRELHGMFQYWKRSTLLVEEFEVFDTVHMGLGVRVTRSGDALLFFRPLSLHALHGFLEVIPESLLEVLRTRGHNSLYKFYDRTTRKWVFSILFGPLSLVNKKSGNSIGFCEMDTQLRTMVLRLTYSYGFMLNGDNSSAFLVDSFQCEYQDEELEDLVTTSDLKPKRLKYGAVVPVQGNALARK